MTISTLVTQLIGLINLAIPIIIGLTLIAFIWRGGLAMFKADHGNAESSKKYREFFLWGVGAIFIMVSIWGILNILNGIFFNTGTNASTTNPAINQYDPTNYNCTVANGCG